MSEIQCAYCDGSGWVQIPGENRTVRCFCHRARQVNLFMEAGLIPPRYRDSSLETITPENPAQAAAIDKLKKYVADWPTRRRAGVAPGLFGIQSRIGKTILACSTVHSILEQYKFDYDFDKRNYPLLFINASEFINRWRNLYARPQSPEGTSDSERWREHQVLVELEKRATTCPLFILDEIGEATGTDFVGGKLYSLIEHRVSHLLPIIFTTNLTWNELIHRCGSSGPRIVGRLQEVTSGIEITL